MSRAQDRDRSAFVHLHFSGRDEAVGPTGSSGRRLASTPDGSTASVEHRGMRPNAMGDHPRPDRATPMRTRRENERALDDLDPISHGNGSLAEDRGAQVWVGQYQAARCLPCAFLGRILLRVFQ
jgi:hypothetical protein